MKTNKIKDIIQYAKEGKSVQDIAKLFNKSVPTINRYIALLRLKGYKVPIKMGRPKITIED